MEKEPILIIGAGIGGLSAAIRLAAAGQRVIIIGKNGALGGKTSKLQACSYTWGLSPSVITLRPV